MASASKELISTSPQPEGTRLVSDVASSRHVDLHRPFCDAYFRVQTRASVITGQVPALKPRAAKN
jgi:hypothetical protein